MGFPLWVGMEFPLSLSHLGLTLAEPAAIAGLSRQTQLWGDSLDFLSFVAANPLARQEDLVLFAQI